MTLGDRKVYPNLFVLEIEDYDRAKNNPFCS